MKEEFLHFIWNYRLYKTPLLSNRGEEVEVAMAGQYNRDSGPDFFNARIKKGVTVWAGNIEMHVRSSDWFRHGHHKDKAYNNVILHVVATDDGEAVTASGTEIDTVVPEVLPGVYEKYRQYLNEPLLIACQNDLALLEPYIFRHWLSYLAVERLEEKTAKTAEILANTGNDWEETLYRLIARYSGSRVNSDNFERVARLLPLKIIRKHSDNLLQVEALLFGVAGLLSDDLFREAVTDSYLNDLKREFRVLGQKYSLVPMHGYVWRFHRLRPAGFPTVRLAQLAALLSGNRPLFSEIMESKTTENLIQLLNRPASEYWRNHYSFGKKSGKRSGAAGESSTALLVINAVVPMLFLYGRSRENNDLCDRSLDLLAALTPEDNRITREWRKIGVECDSALISQSLNTLLEKYCRRRRCLQCRVGNELIAMKRTPLGDTNTLMEE